MSVTEAKVRVAISFNRERPYQGGPVNRVISFSQRREQLRQQVLMGDIDDDFEAAMGLIMKDTDL